MDASARTMAELMTADQRTLRFSPHGLLLDRLMKPESSLRFLQDMLAKTELAPAVPEDVQDYLRIARSLHVYGLFVYDFFTLAFDRAHFACELALRLRHKEFKDSADSSTKHQPPFRSLLQWARREGLISDERDPEWLHVLADLRNFAAHPQGRRVVTPVGSAVALEISASLINELWTRPGGL